MISHALASAVTPIGSPMPSGVTVSLTCIGNFAPASASVTLDVLIAGKQSQQATFNVPACGETTGPFLVNETFLDWVGWTINSNDTCHGGSGDQYSAAATAPVWTGGCGSGNPSTRPGFAYGVVTASFSSVPVLVLSSNPVSVRNVVSISAEGKPLVGCNAGSICTYNVAAGSSIVITALPAGGVAFQGWSVASSGNPSGVTCSAGLSSNPCMFNQPTGVMTVLVGFSNSTSNVVNVSSSVQAGTTKLEMTPMTQTAPTVLPPGDFWTIISSIATVAALIVTIIALYLQSRKPSKRGRRRQREPQKLPASNEVTSQRSESLAKERTTGDYDYDVFICHASEDKDQIARPLAEALTKKGLRVWYDEFTLKVGDSLRQRIDYGLAHSRYGIVILSPFFFKKNWPQRELDGLAAREDSEGHKVILPVWHGVDRDYVLKYSPTLADRLASNAANGLQTVLAEMLEVILEPMKPKNQAGQEDTELNRKKPTAEVPTVTQQEGRRWLQEPLTREQRLSRRFPLVLRTVDSLTKEDGLVKEEDLIVALQDKLNHNESLELVQLLLMEGLLYIPKPGYVKRTNLPR